MSMIVGSTQKEHGPVGRGGRAEVSRPSDRARAAVREAKGWIVDDASIFVDDGISGAEFATRPRFLRLMNALKPHPPSRC